MCLLGRADPYRGRGRYSIVTVINGPADNDWATALKRGYIHLSPPPPRFSPTRPRVTWRDSLRIARQQREAAFTVTLRIFLQVQAERRAKARAAHAHARARHEQGFDDYSQARIDARDYHLRRTGVAH